jgi:hypothetical protein
VGTFTFLSQSSPQTSIMQASMRDILAAIAFGTIVYRARLQISPLARLHRLRNLVST